MCKPIMEEMRNTIDEAIKASGIDAANMKFQAERTPETYSKDNIHFVEIIGGASRVPWVRTILSEKFCSIDLSRTVNADECIARGCALMAAIQSPAYKVRDFKLEDKCGRTVTISWQ